MGDRRAVCSHLTAVGRLVRLRFVANHQPPSRPTDSVVRCHLHSAKLVAYVKSSWPKCSSGPFHHAHAFSEWSPQPARGQHCSLPDRQGLLAPGASPASRECSRPSDQSPSTKQEPGVELVESGAFVVYADLQYKQQLRRLHLPRAQSSTTPALSRSLRSTASADLMTTVPSASLGETTTVSETAATCDSPVGLGDSVVSPAKAGALLMSPAARSAASSSADAASAGSIKTKVANETVSASSLN